MRTKIPWPDKVKIWELHYLKETPTDKIRYELPQHEDKKEDRIYSWETVKSVVDEFPLLSQAQAGELPDNLEMRWKELQSQKDATQPGPLQVDQHGAEDTAKTVVLDTAQTHELIQKWRIELESCSPIHLLERWLNDASEDALGRFFIDKDTKMLYLEARRPYLETLDPKRLCLEVEGDPTFGLLRQKFPTSTVWTALEAWGEQAIPYLRAFSHLVGDSETAIDLAVSEEGVDDSNLSAFITKCSMKRAYAVLIICDLLKSGITDPPSNLRWTLLMRDLEKLRLRANLELSLLTNRIQKGGWPTANLIEQISADPQDHSGLIQSSRRFSTELVKLQVVQDQLAIAFQELECKNHFR